MKFKIAHICHLEIVKAPHLNEKSSNFDESWYTTADLELGDSHLTLRKILAHDAIQAWPMPSCGVRLSVCHVREFCQNQYTYLQNYFQTSWQYSDRNLHNGGVECRWRKQKSQFPTSVWLRVLSTLRPPGVINTAPPDCGRLWQSLLVASSRVCWRRETTTRCLWQVSMLCQRQQNSI